MMTHKKSLGFGAALLMAVSTGSVYAEGGEMTQTRSQDRVRTEVNLQTPGSELGQARLQEQKMLQTQSQIRSGYRDNFQTRQNNSAAGSAARQNMMNRSNRGRR